MLSDQESSPLARATLSNELRSLLSDQESSPLARAALSNELMGLLVGEPVPRTIQNPRADIEVATLGENGHPRAAADVLIDIGKRGDLFHAPDGEPYARVSQGGATALHAINSAAFADFLCGEYYALTGKGANRNAIADARTTLAAIAKFEGTCEPVHLRVAGDSRKVLIDSGERDPACYEFTPERWRALRYHPVNFRRSPKATALPQPTFGNFQLIAQYINVDPSDLVLIGGWLLSAFRPAGPYPLLVLTGEQGSAKSTTLRILKALTDPSEVPLRAPPRDERDLLIAAHTTRVVALDNLSGLAPELSDALCRLSTGGGFSARKLYTDAEETLIAVQCPVMLNGIDDVVSRPDLAERSVHISTPQIVDRATEATLAKGFERDAPKILAALFDGVSLALRDTGKLSIHKKPRMADFVEWAAAGVPALGFTSEQFLTAYRGNSAAAVELGLDTSPLARALLDMVAVGATWTGGANDLLAQLAARVSPHERDSAVWPRSAKGLLTMLRRLAPSLRHVGLDYVHTRSATARRLTLTRRPSDTSAANNSGDASLLQLQEAGSLRDAAAIFHGS